MKNSLCYISPNKSIADLLHRNSTKSITSESIKKSNAASKFGDNLTKSINIVDTYSSLKTICRNLKVSEDEKENVIINKIQLQNNCYKQEVEQLKNS